MSRFAVLWLIAGACSTGVPPEEEEQDGACELAEASAICPACDDGPVSCAFGDTEVTVSSCGECQSRGTLYQALCDAGEPATAETIEAEAVCEAVSCEITFDTCVDPCTPVCGATSAAFDPSTPCDLGCTTPLPAPGECVWTGLGCDWQ